LSYSGPQNYLKSLCFVVGQRTTSRGADRVQHRSPNIGRNLFHWGATLGTCRLKQAGFVFYSMPLSVHQPYHTTSIDTGILKGNERIVKHGNIHRSLPPLPPPPGTGGVNRGNQRVARSLRFRIHVVIPRPARRESRSACNQLSRDVDGFFYICPRTCLPIANKLPPLSATFSNGSLAFVQEADSRFPVDKAAEHSTFETWLP
jgi:hypothetical protein